jgi:ubiquinone/menaquinone biosynthesis C-methylase UbiE
MIDWDKYAQRVFLDERLYEHDPNHKKRAEEIVKRCEGKTLDAGAGDGYITNLIKKKGLEVVGLEISDVRIRNAKEKYNLNFIKGDVNNLPFADNSFDTVVVSEVLEHTDNIGQGLKEAIRVANKKVIMTLPIGDWEEPTHFFMIDYLYIPATSQRGMLIIEIKKV